MSTAVDPSKLRPLPTRAMAAFLAPGCPEVFHSIATPTEIWTADPYDVETIHAEAREAFERIAAPGRPHAAAAVRAVLVLQGEAGSGKTHLMRAFRTRADAGVGYCGYLQMTTEVSNYARYMLNNLIDGLEQPYAPDGPSRTGLGPAVGGAVWSWSRNCPRQSTEAFRDGEGRRDRLADDYADRLQADERFRGCDLELLRVMLHLERNETRGCAAGR